jgi:ribonucleotide reductase alpha subunit
VDAEQNESIPRKTIGAQELFLDLLKERAETGRIYIMNIDHCNSHSSFIDKVEMSNLCVAGDTQITIEFYYGKDYVRKTISIKNLYGYIDDPNYKDLKVLSYNIESNQEEWKPITAFAETSPKAKVMKITDEESGKGIVVTPEHKVFTKNRGYVMAKDLTETDELVVI